MKTQQVFVRAKNKEGKWDNIDVMALDDRSFKAFVIEKLLNAGLVFGLADFIVEGEEITLQEKED